MALELKFSVITACVGNLGDRFLTSGTRTMWAWRCG